MNTITAKWRQIVASLKEKAYRDAFVSDYITNGLAFQIRATREARGWTQADLGAKSGMAQETICLLENPDYGKFTLKTLKRLASAFDVGLCVRFVPFSELAHWATGISRQDLVIPDYEHDADLDLAAGVDLTKQGDDPTDCWKADNVVEFPKTATGISIGTVNENPRVDNVVQMGDYRGLRLASEPEVLFR